MKRMLCFPALLVSSAAATLGVLDAQTAPGKSAKFEVVSIKPTPTGAAPGRAGLQPGGRYIVTNGPVRLLINAAFETDSNEIVGAPDWVMRDPYDVTTVAGRDIEWEELGPMMREMLAERFKLVARVETRERPVFALVRANSDGRLGPNLRATTDCALREVPPEGDKRPAQIVPPVAGERLGPCRTRSAPGRMESTGFTMEGLASNLSYPAGRKVIDRTGLKGDYEFTLEYAFAPSGTGIEKPGDKPSLFTALQEQLGLRLQPDVAPLSVVVVDRIERPTPD